MSPAPSAPPIVDDYLKTASGPAFEQARRLGRGVNLGNALDAPKEGEWGIVLREEDFELVADAGFEHVRIPVRWSTHAASAAPFSIEPEFAARVKWAIDSALAARLRVVVNVHHYEEMYDDPDGHAARLSAIWKQIAESYQGYPDTLYFELFNEPHAKLTPEKNNALISELLAVIRPMHPERSVVVGGTEWSSLRGLSSLEVPVSDPHLIVISHYYDPFEFTHQGAERTDQEDLRGIDWPGAVGRARHRGRLRPCGRVGSCAHTTALPRRAWRSRGGRARGPNALDDRHRCRGPRPRCSVRLLGASVPLRSLWPREAAVAERAARCRAAPGWVQVTRATSGASSAEP